MVDTHTHLYLQDDFPGEEAAQAVQRAIDAGVSRMLFPNVGQDTIEPMLSLHRQFPGNTAVAIGLHPTEVTGEYQSQLTQMREALDNALQSDDIKVAAIGEVGIDLYWDKSCREEQKKALDEQLHWAEELSLPVIIHCRDGVQAIIEVLEGYTGNLPRLIFHCFTGTAEDVRALRKYGDHWFGVGGVVTFKNADAVREAIKEVGMNRLLLETDSPYLAPVPMRGKRNESAWMVYTASYLATLFGISMPEVERITDANANTIFPTF